MNKKTRPLHLSRTTLRTLADEELPAAGGALGNHTLFDCTYRYCSLGTCPDPRTTGCPQ